MFSPLAGIKQFPLWQELFHTNLGQGGALHVVLHVVLAHAFGPGTVVAGAELF